MRRTLGSVQIYGWRENIMIKGKKLSYVKSYGVGVGTNKNGGETFLIEK